MGENKFAVFNPITPSFDSSSILKKIVNAFNCTFVETSVINRGPASWGFFNSIIVGRNIIKIVRVIPIRVAMNSVSSWIISIKGHYPLILNITISLT